MKSNVPRICSALALAVSLVVAPRAVAAPARQPPRSSAPAGESAPPGKPTATKASPTIETEQPTPPAQTPRERGEALEALGDFAGAGEAYQRWADAAQTDAERTQARASQQRVNDASRGRVETEPASTRRNELDARWAAPAPAKVEPPKPGAVSPVADTAPPRGERIVTKWYFWVTIIAIAASAGAVAGIAIKASRDERRDSLDSLQRAPSGGFGGPAVIRF